MMFCAASVSGTASRHRMRPALAMDASVYRRMRRRSRWSVATAGRHLLLDRGQTVALQQTVGIHVRFYFFGAQVGGQTPHRSHIFADAAARRFVHAGARVLDFGDALLFELIESGVEFTSGLDCRGTFGRE